MRNEAYDHCEEGEGRRLGVGVGDCGVVALPVSRPLHSPASRFDGRAVRTKESGTWLTATVYRAAAILQMSNHLK